VKLALRVNGEAREVEARADESVLDVLRRELGLLSVRETCGIGVCGACTVLVDGAPMSGCLLLAPLAAGRELTTVEGLGNDHPVQHAFAEARGFQCGYCTPGMILTAASLLAEHPRPSEAEVRLAMAGNLCRCGSYVKIIDAVLRAADQKEDAWTS
jgi:aerobic-type carbon monoxide dehydrogenase small subunit (CoxS/CutS family)